MSDNQNIDTTTNINETDTNKTSTDHADDYEKICYVCRRPESKCGPIIQMPGGINICSECMQKTMDSLQNADIPGFDMSRMPFNIKMVDLSQLGPMGMEIPERQRVKKKKSKKFVSIKLMDYN